MGTEERRTLKKCSDIENKTVQMIKRQDKQKSTQVREEQWRLKHWYVENVSFHASTLVGRKMPGELQVVKK